IQLKKYSEKYPNLQEDYKSVTNQIIKLCKLGHECALHIHPHWEDSIHDGQKWIINSSRYKLKDFEVQEAQVLFKKYADFLWQITGNHSPSYRAGGWCIQPFVHIKNAFIENGIKIDSTVFIGGKNQKRSYYYDFTNCPSATKWKFNNDLTKEIVDGQFIEIPISSRIYSPLFFWRLYILGRLFPKIHKPIGNGRPISDGGSKLEILTKYSLKPISSDGYFASSLLNSLSKIEKKGNEMVVIGHPKACTLYSLKKLDEFIGKAKISHNFKKIQDSVQN
ncbi:MAG: hypothetical protein K2Q22_18125, partial [Cytophagales bacterium]|nr:hypothetical protein [Cytophagales bacterium]